MATPLLPPIPRRKPSEDDRRRSTRVPHVAEAWVCSPTDFELEHKTEVRAVNLSRHGLAFDVDSPMATGSFKVIEIGIGDQTVRSEIRIISCRQTNERHYEVGAEFC